ncbi:MAG: 1-acyl-sn-glycerol-3-phosphate acyltransferase [Firmicutes bacterium]|nr:1-acyl-sn-glycerol-3-phosphate acyltransferase [Bacillota bacterium]
MKVKKTSRLSRFIFKILRSLVHFFYGNVQIEGLENLPDHNAVIVANHAQTNGPIIGELFLPANVYIWCAGQMMNLKEIPTYAFNDFWSHKLKWTHPFFKLMAHLITPLAFCLFNNARTIPVYRDKRIISTFRESLDMLKDGRNLLIFPEKDEKCNNILYEFQENFVDVARLYYRKTGQELTFVPMYIAPTLKKAYIGQGIKYDSKNEVTQERKRIVAILTDSITHIARSLPLHTVVPYRNFPRKYYLTNKDVTEVPHEKARC